MSRPALHGKVDVLGAHGLRVTDAFRYETGIRHKKYMFGGWKPCRPRKEAFKKIILTRALLQAFAENTCRKLCGSVSCNGAGFF